MRNWQCLVPKLDARPGDLPLPITMSLGAPLRLEVFPHIEFAGHGFSHDFPSKCERKSVSDCAFRQPALQLNRVAIDYAAEVARDEFAAMDPLNASALLMEREGV